MGASERMLRLFGLILVFFTLCFESSAQGQTFLNGQMNGFDESDSPSVLHVRHFDAPSLGLGNWLESVLVHSDGSFSADLGILSGPTLFEFSAPPWSWMAMVRPNETSSILLSPSEKRSNRLMNLPGVVRWNEDHPSLLLDSLAQIQQSLLMNLLEPRMAKSRGLGSSVSDSLRQVTWASDSVFQKTWAGYGQRLSDPVFRDVWWQAQWRWQQALGSSEAIFDSLWIQWEDSRPFQNLQSCVQSPGWMEAWFVRYDQWWKGRDVNREGIEKAVYLADLDTLRHSMGPNWINAPIEDVAIVWLMKAIDFPDKLTMRIWETMAFPAAIQALYKRLKKHRDPYSTFESRQEIRWTLPNGDLQYYTDFCKDSWRVMLVVRDGSRAALREREVFTKIMENDLFSNICFLVISADVSETGWYASLEQRRSIDEELVWLGNAPQNYEALGIYGIPQIVAIGPNGQISQNIHSLPSQGLGAELELMISPFRRNH